LRRDHTLGHASAFVDDDDGDGDEGLGLFKGKEGADVQPI